MTRFSFAGGCPFVIPLILLIAGCQQPADAGNDGARETANAGTAQPSAAASNAVEEEAATAPAPAQIASKTDLLEFSYGWPAEAAAIPSLDAWLRGNGDAILKRWQAQSKRDFAASKADGWVWRTYSYEERYAVAADTPLMLVMISEGYMYTGGAHGMPVSTAIIWDKAARKRLATEQVIDIAALKRIAQARFCEALDRQREEKRGEPVPPDRPGMFDECVDITKQMIVPVSVGGRALDTIRVIIGPYEAGPYAEGTYVIDLPMTSDLLPAVKPAYRAAFDAK